MTSGFPHTGLSNLDVALILARIGLAVVPCCWPGDAGRCGHSAHYRKDGSRKHEEKDIGKVSLLAGRQVALRSEKSIRDLWGRYPQANVAIHLGLSRLLVADADSDQARMECVLH